MRLLTSLYGSANVSIGSGSAGQSLWGVKVFCRLYFMWVWFVACSYRVLTLLGAWATLTEREMCIPGTGRWVEEEGREEEESRQTEFSFLFI